MRAFYLGWVIWQTPSAKFEVRAKCPTPNGVIPAETVKIVSGPSRILQTLSDESSAVFPLSWSHYVRLISVENPTARAFYEVEAIRGGWSVRQLDRQIGTQFFERTAHSTRQAVHRAITLRRGFHGCHEHFKKEEDWYFLNFLDGTQPAVHM